MPETPEFVEYLSIRFDADHVSDMAGGRVERRFPKSSIKQVLLVRDRPSKHPVVQVAVGIVITMIGALPIPVVVNWFLYGGTISTAYVWWMVWVPLGIWVVLMTFRKQLHVSLLTHDGREERILFNDTPKPDEIARFLRAIRTEFDYKVKSLTHEVEI